MMLSIAEYIHKTLNKTEWTSNQSIYFNSHQIIMNCQILHRDLDQGLEYYYVGTVLC